MSNDDFNIDMDKYIRKIRRKRSDEVDYSSGQAKAKTVSEGAGIVHLGDEEIIIEEKEERGIKKLFLSIFKKRTPQEDPELIEEIEIDETPEPEITKEELEQVEEEIEEFEERTTSLFDKLFAFFRSNKSENFEEEELDTEIVTDGEVIEDIKETFKAINSWLEKLPNDEKEKFKNSSDFKTYKSFLKKYNLIKKN